MKKTKIYTRGGDAGTSQLLSVGRVPKDHVRLVAYGDTDELNSVIGVAVAYGLTAPLAEQLAQIQHDLFVLGSQIAVPHPDKINLTIPQLDATHTSKLEVFIDALDDELPALKNFILPGGSLGGAQLHHARTVCRRCERHLQRLHHAQALPPQVLTYSNRLSDYLFTAARYENAKQGVSDVVWKTGD